MNPWPFVAASYAAVLGATAALTLASWWAMRRAERPLVPSGAERPLASKVQP